MCLIARLNQSTSCSIDWHISRGIPVSSFDGCGVQTHTHMHLKQDNELADRTGFLGEKYRALLLKEINTVNLDTPPPLKKQQETPPL